MEVTSSDDKAPSATIPAGLTVRLSRCRVKPGARAEADRWMRMLNDRAAECVDTLDRERMAIEIVFRLGEGDADFLYWVTVSGEGVSVEDSPHPIDRDHLEAAGRTKEPGWVEAEPQLVASRARACCGRELGTTTLSSLVLSLRK